MINPRRLLPSISMLMAFDAAARSSSFTTAAKELSLTQGAVSKQINSLEALLGVKLFVRLHQTVDLTDSGKVYAQEILTALDHIRAASIRVISSPQGGMLNVAVLPTFGTRWLMPRLPSFLKAYPDITLNFMTRLSPFDFRTENIHAAVHFGADDWPGTESTYLMGEAVVPLCSPQFKAEYGVRIASDLARVPLLHISSRSGAWQQWFLAQNMCAKNSRGMVFEEFLTAAQAAVAGTGAVLLPEFLVNHELERGELVAIDTQPIKSDYGYYLVVPQQQTHYAPGILFKEWLLGQVSDT